MLVVMIGALALRPQHLGRRDLGAAVTAALALPTSANGASALLDAKIAKQIPPIQPLLTAVASTTTASEFSDASDSLVLWIIGKGEIPEGVDAKVIRDVLRATYQELPQRAYPCERTRDNNGVCYSPG